MFIQQEMTAEAFLAFADQHQDRRFDFIYRENIEVTPKPVHGRKQTLFADAQNNSLYEYFGVRK